MRNLTPTTKAHLGLLLSNLIWACNYPFYKIIMPHYFSPYALLMLAMAVAASLALLSFLFSPLERVRRTDIIKLIMAAVLLGVSKKLFLMIGIQHTSPIDASIITTLGPILVLVISVLFMIDRFTTRKVIGMALGLTGTLAVILNHSGGEGTAKLTGNLLVVLGVVCSSFAMVWLKDVIMRYKPITLLRWIYPLAAVLILPLGLKPLMETDFSVIPAHVWWMIAYVTLMPTFGPNYLLLYSLHYVKPTISSIYVYLQPVLATGISILMGLDKLSWERGIAAICVFAGVLLVVESYKNHPSAPRHWSE